MRRSIKRFYEIDRTYDFAERSNPGEKKFIKKRSHKRLRRQKVCSDEILTNKEN